MSDRASPLTTALEQLNLKLLDLTGRNRLINFKHTAGAALVPGYDQVVIANHKNGVIQVA